MIDANEARKITEESGKNIDIQPLLDELDKAIRSAAALGLSSISVQKTDIQLARECKVPGAKISSVRAKIKAAVEAAGYEADTSIICAGPEVTTYSIDISWGRRTADDVL